jgi:predicted metalloprotease
MRFRQGSRLDTSQVSDRRRAGGGAMVAGGGGIVGLIVLAITLFAGGGGGGGGAGLSDLVIGGQQVQGDNTELSASCETGADANQDADCRIVGVVNSVQEFWADTLPDYREVPTVFFSGSTRTGCGGASAATGPFYCPADEQVYIDLTFYDELRSRFGATGGPFAEAYVIAHEYGHHVEGLQGTLDRSQDGSTGPTSSSVRIELMADCYAGLWAAGAMDTGYISELTEADIRDGLDAASAIGDDRIQESVSGRVDPEAFTHGSSEQRQKWFLVGYEDGSVESCDTFATDDL